MSLDVATITAVGTVAGLVVGYLGQRLQAKSKVVDTLATREHALHEVLQTQLSRLQEKKDKAEEELREERRRCAEEIKGLRGEALTERGLQAEQVKTLRAEATAERILYTEDIRGLRAELNKVRDENITLMRQDYATRRELHDLREKLATINDPDTLRALAEIGGRRISDKQHQPETQK